MTETPHPNLLPREQGARGAREIFGPQLALLEEMVNYGSNLIPRAFASSGKKLHDIVIIHNFLKQAVTLLDGVHLAAGAGSAINGKILLRGIFEIRIYLDWVFANPAERGRLYYVWDVRRTRLWTRRGIPGTPENELFRKHTGTGVEGVSFHPFSTEDLVANCARCDAKLAHPELAPINAKFEALNRGQKEWYRAGGVQNLREMARAVGLEKDYAICFPWLSNLTHGLALAQHVELGPAEVEGLTSLKANAIRSIVGLDELLQHTFNFSHRIFMAVIRHYRPDEFQAHCRKYLNEWRERMMSIPRIEIVGDEIHITPTTPPPMPGQPGF